MRETKTRKLIKEAYERGYRVTEDGELYGLKGKPLSVRLRGKQRYPTFSLNGVKETKSGVFGIPVHMFAAFCFYGDQVFSLNSVVRHLNGDSLGVSKDNLRIGTSSENERDKPKEVRVASAKRARASQGYRSFNAVLSDDEVRELRRLRKEGLSYKALGERFGMTRQGTFRVVKGLCYADVS